MCGFEDELYRLLTGERIGSEMQAQVVRGGKLRAMKVTIAVK